jgi:hypothetical protein
MINQSTNQPDSVYVGGNTNYTVRLSRQGTDLSPVTINEISRDTTRAGWGDHESLTMPLTGNSGGTLVYSAPEVVNGSQPNPTPGNGTLESDLNGELVLSWVHPRDSRESAIYILPGKKVQVVPPFIIGERVKPVPGGPLPPGVVNPGVIIVGVGGVERLNPDSVNIGSKTCIPPLNCNLNINPHQVPSFIFRIPPAAFNYSVSIYDHLGQYVYDEKGRHGGAYPPGAVSVGTNGEPDSATILIQVPPIAKNGRPWGTGVYIYKIAIQTDGNVDYRNQNGNTVRLSASYTQLFQRSGYVRGAN